MADGAGLRPTIAIAGCRLMLLLGTMVGDEILRQAKLGHAPVDLK